MRNRQYAWRGAFVGCFALTLAIATGSNAFAQCTTATQTGPFGGFLNNAATAGGAAAGAFAGALGNLSTAFLTQQGSAFVAAPGDPKPDQPGGGVWIRGVGGEVTNKFSSSSNASLTGLGPGGDSTANTTGCAGSVRQTFAGVQVGQDISRLNWNGWNFHLGTTAGYLSSHATSSTGAKSDFEVPFLGAYLVATRGRFFADVMVRKEFYSANLTDASIGLLGQQMGAHGVSIATSVGYNAALANNWFIEPSAGFIWSRTDVDSLSVAGDAGFVSTFKTAPIESEIGRLTLRAGTVINSDRVTWQPFASASVFHEFAGNISTSAASIPNGAFVGAVPITIAGANSTTRVGTYGQYSIGLAAQVVNTGLLGFVRVDYRNGQNIDGWTGNAGIRYQFTPETIATIMPVKAAVKVLPPGVAQSDWTGFYAGGYLGVGAGRTEIGFPGGDPASSGANPHVFGGIGGIQAGYNRQFAQWVVGVEGEIGAANIHGSRTAGSDAGLNGAGLSVRFSPAFFVAEDKTNWQGALTGRLGYAWGRTLFYGKGGVAFEDSSTTATCIFGPAGQVPIGGGLFRSCLNPAGAVTAAFSTPYYTRVGGVVGYGAEFDLGNNWSAKAEYDYRFFGRHSAIANDGTVVTDKAWSSQVKVGVNYRFGSSVVVAKY